MFNWLSVYKEFYEFNPNPKQAAVATYHQLKYGNNWERVVFGKQTNVRKAEKVRYEWAAKHVSENDCFIDLGCGSGYGSQFAPGMYVGVDLDPVIIKFAISQFEKSNVRFSNTDIQSFLSGSQSLIKDCGVLVAFEIIEHISNGKELAQQLKNSGAKKVLLSVPYNERPGRWGPHHMLHRLTIKDFPGYEATYMDMQTGLTYSNPPTSEDRDYLLLL